MSVKNCENLSRVVNPKLEEENSSWGIRDVRIPQREHRPNLEESKIYLENSGQSREGREF